MVMLSYGQCPVLYCGQWVLPPRVNCCQFNTVVKVVVIIIDTLFWMLCSCVVRTAWHAQQTRPGGPPGRGGRVQCGSLSLFSQA